MQLQIFSLSHSPSVHSITDLYLLFVALLPIAGGNNAKLEDLQKTLTSYGVTDGSTLMLIILERFSLYVIGLDGGMHEVEIPSSDPEVRLYIYIVCMAISGN